MRRITTVLAIVALLVTTIAALATPATAQLTRGERQCIEDLLEENPDLARSTAQFLCAGEVESCDFDVEISRECIGAQDLEQEAESGDVDQTFEVSGEGDNSNQCVGIQGVTNTGNSQSALGITQIDGDAEDFEFDEVDSSIEVNPMSETTCDQQVNQAASASG